MEVNQAVHLAGVVCPARDFLEKEADVENTIRSLLEVMTEDQKLFVPAISPDFRDMLEEGRRLQKISSQIVMMVGCDFQSLMALKACRTMHIPAASSRVFQSDQALLAQNNQPAMIFMNYSQLAKHADAFQVWHETAEIFGDKKSLLMAEGIQSSAQLRQAALAGIENVSCTIDVYRALYFNALHAEEVNDIRDGWIMTYTRTDLLENRPAEPAQEK